jgi:hypothetical protein
MKIKHLDYPGQSKVQGRERGTMNATLIIKAEKPECDLKIEVKAAGGGFRGFLKKLYNWSLIDGDVFLESKDWPYLWKK